MRAGLAALPVAVALVALVASAVTAVAPSAADAAAVDCTYSPVLTPRIAVDQPTLNFTTPVRIGGTDCTHVFTASESLQHSGDTYFLNWTQDSRTASDAIYATTVKPGTYSTTNPMCGVRGSDGTNKTCSVGAGSTVIKFAGRVGLTATREKAPDQALVHFFVRATRYAPNETRYIATTVTIQRYGSGAWHTIHSAVAKGASGYAWTTRDADVAGYRAVAAESTVSFAAVSAGVRQ